MMILTARAIAVVAVTLGVIALGVMWMLMGAWLGEREPSMTLAGVLVAGLGASLFLVGV
jgi:hypothetical protein